MLLVPNEIARVLSGSALSIKSFTTSTFILAVFFDTLIASYGIGIKRLGRRQVEIIAFFRVEAQARSHKLSSAAKGWPSPPSSYLTTLLDLHSVWVIQKPNLMELVLLLKPYGSKSGTYVPDEINIRSGSSQVKVWFDSKSLQE